MLILKLQRDLNYNTQKCKIPGIDMEKITDRSRKSNYRNEISEPDSVGPDCFYDYNRELTLSKLRKGQLSFERQLKRTSEK